MFLSVFYDTCNPHFPMWPDAVAGLASPDREQSKRDADQIRKQDGSCFLPDLHRFNSLIFWGFAWHPSHRLQNVTSRSYRCHCVFLYSHAQLFGNQAAFRSLRLGRLPKGSKTQVFGRIAASTESLSEQWGEVCRKKNICTFCSIVAS